MLLFMKYMELKAKRNEKYDEEDKERDSSCGRFVSK
jgi:ribosomal protein S14